MGKPILTESMTCRFINFFDEWVAQHAFVVDYFDANSFGKECFAIVQDFISITAKVFTRSI